MCLGIPGQIVEISDATQMRAKVDVDGVRSEVSVALLGLEGPEAARVGDWVLVHVGFANRAHLRGGGTRNARGLGAAEGHVRAGTARVLRRRRGCD